MAATNILKSYLIKLGVSVDRRGLDGFMGAVAKGVSTVAKFGAATVGAFGVVQAGLMKLASSESALNSLSERVGVTAGEIERMGYVASQSGGSALSMNSALEQLTSKAGQAAMGLAGAQRVFRDIGLDIRGANGGIKSATTLLDDLGKVLSGQDRHRQLAALDRLGIDRTLLKAITTDVSGLKAEFDDMARATGVDFDKTARAASELTDEVGKTSTFIRLTTKVLGANLMGDTANWLRRLRGWIRENSVEIQGAIETGVKVIQSGGIFVGRTLQRIGQGIAFLHKKTEGLSTAFLALAGVVALLGWPVTLAAAGIAAVVLLVDDLITALEGGKTLFDWSPWLDDIRAAGRWLDDLAGKIRDEALTALKELKGWLDDVAKDFGLQDLNQAFEVIKDALPGILRDLGAFIEYLGGKFWDVIKGVFGWLGGTIRFIINLLKELGDFVLNVLSGNFEAAFKNIENIVGRTVDFIISSFGRALDFVKGVITVIGDAINKTKELLGLGSSSAENGGWGKVKELIKNDEGMAENDAKPGLPGGVVEKIDPITAVGNLLTGLLGKEDSPKTGIGPEMLAVGPALHAGSGYRNRGESGPVEITQTNSITITGMQNAREIGNEVGKSLNDANRKAGDQYRYMVGRQ